MKMGDISTEFKYETEHVRVWDLVLEPNKSSDWHIHENNYLFVVTRAGTLLAEHENGDKSESFYELGQVVIGHKGAIHKVTNTGPELYSNAIIEIKNN